jgi:ribonuclease J
MLVKHAETAQSMGVPAENMIIIQNGDVIELTEHSIRVAGKVPSGIELVDTTSSGMVSSKVLQERQRIASEGLVTIAAAIDWSGKLLAKPEIHMQGVVTSIERSLLLKWVQQRIEEILSVRWSEFVTGSGQNDIDWGGLQVTLEKELQRSLRRELQCQPSLTLLMQVPDGLPAPAVNVSDGRRRRTRSTAVAS